MDPNSGINLVEKQQQQFQDLLNKQNTTSDQYFNEYKNAIGGQQKLQDVLKQAQNQRGLGQLQSSIGLFQQEMSGVKGLLDKLPENLAQRTAGTFTTQGVLDRQNAVEGGALRTQLSRLASGLEPIVQAYGLASDDVGQLLSATQAQQAKELSPYEKRLDSLSDRYSREVTGFTFNKENELNVLLDKLQRERELNDREWEAAQKLAQQENEFAYQKYLAQQAGKAPGQSQGGGVAVLNSVSNKAGQTLGFDTPTRSYLTNVGQKEQDAANARSVLASNLRQDTGAIGKYGPLALFGGGWLWGK